MTVVRHPYSRVSRGGGGAGYLFNLKSAVEQYGGNSDIRFEIDASIIAPAVPASPPPSIVKRVVRKIKRTLISTGSSQTTESPRPKTASDQIPDDFDDQLQGYLRWGIDRYAWIDKEYATRLFDCDLLFANDIWMAVYIQRLCPELAREKFVIISHSPTWTGVEVAAEIVPELPEDRVNNIPSVKRLREQHLEVMSSVKAVLWPCKEAVEEYPEWVVENNKGIGTNVFAETGVLRPETAKPVSQLRSEWGISPDKRIVLFIGRAHPHKGFDRFVDWADASRKAGDDKYVFVHAGAHPQTHRDLSSIHPVGYITDNGTAYLAADLVVIPNRHSFLDIGLLEAMSLGAKVAITKTGGHIMMSQVCPEMPVIPDGDPTTVWQALKQFADEYAESDSRQLQYRSLWERRFSAEPFYRNHVNVVTDLRARASAG